MPTSTLNDTTEAGRVDLEWAIGRRGEPPAMHVGLARQGCSFASLRPTLRTPRMGHGRTADRLTAIFEP